MTRQNYFTIALESAALTGTVGPDAVTEQSTMQPKPGFSKGEAEPSEDKTKKEFGEDHVLTDSDDFDTVAESQEHTLALEHLQAAAMRFSRVAAALEEISEQATDQLEAGQPMDPSTVAMLTTAVDAAGVGEPLADSVATESFGFSPQIATENFVDTLKERAQRVWAAAAKFAKKAWQVTQEKLKRFADYFRSLVSIYTKLEKEGDVLASNANKPFQNAKWEKAVQDRLFSPASTKTVIAAVDNAAAEANEVLKLIDGKISADLMSLQRAWKTEKAETVVAAMNKVLASTKGLTDMGNGRFKHSAYSTEVNLPDRVAVQGTGGLEGVKVVFENGISEFSAGIKTASMADIKHLRQMAERADNLIRSNDDPLWEKAFGEEGEEGMQEYMDYLTRGTFSDEKGEVARQLLIKYSNLTRVVVDLLAGCTYGAVAGYYGNMFAASKWIRYSIAEAKAAARGGN